MPGPADMWRVVVLLILVISAAASAGDQETAMENTWGSEMRILEGDKIRISTRIRVAGDMDEINEPGTTIFKAFQNVQQAALLRAALESNLLGFDLFQITSTRNITKQRERNRVTGAAREGDFTMAPGQYSEEIDLGIQITAQLVKGPFPEPMPGDMYNATELLIAFGLAKAVPSNGTAGGK